MSKAESSQVNDDSRGGRVVWLDDFGDSFGKLVPKATIDYLLSENERLKAAEESKAFAAVGRSMFVTEHSLYPIFYECAQQRIASGLSPSDIRDELLLIEADAAPDLAAVIRSAYVDVLAGRPPRIASQF